jgi:hypothetical protein
VISEVLELVLYAISLENTDLDSEALHVKEPVATHSTRAPLHLASGADRRGKGFDSFGFPASGPGNYLDVPTSGCNGCRLFWIEDIPDFPLSPVPNEGGLQLHVLLRI